MDTSRKEPISYRPISSGTRLAGEKDGISGDAGPASGDIWLIVKIAAFLLGFVLLVMALGKAL